MSPRAWRRALLAEALKLTTLPATRWALAVACTTGLGLALLLRTPEPGTAPPGFEAVAWWWTQAVQLIVLTVGLLVGAGEHAHAQARTTLQILPWRTPVWLSRTVVLVAWCALLAMAVTAIGVLASAHGATAEAVRAGARVATWLVAAAVISLCVGELVRSMTGAATAVALLVVLAPGLKTHLGTMGRWLPGAAAHAWVVRGHEGAVILAWIGALVLLAWARQRHSDA